MPHRRIMAAQNGVVQMNDRMTDVVAAAAVTSYYWLPNLETWSAIAGTITPIFGLVWLVLQILGKLAEWHGKYLAWRIKRKQAVHINKAMEQQEEFESVKPPKIIQPAESFPEQ